MRKRLFIFMFLLLFVGGCSIQKVNVNQIDSLINQVLLKESKLKNNVFDGYSYYIPRGLKFINKEEYNALLRDYYNNSYYLYVDVVRYYHKEENTYKENKDAYYSRKIKSENKSGYLEINKVKDKYFIEAVYNYVKIEVYTDKSHLSDTIISIFEILSSVCYNDSVLATTIGDKVLNYKEETFNIFTTKKATTDYLDYIEKYDSGALKNRENEQFQDESTIDITIDEE